jgi:hypothetical protein
LAAGLAEVVSRSRHANCVIFERTSRLLLSSTASQRQYRQSPSRALRQGGRQARRAGAQAAALRCGRTVSKHVSSRPTQQFRRVMSGDEVGRHDISEGHAIHIPKA